VRGSAIGMVFGETIPRTYGAWSQQAIGRRRSVSTKLLRPPTAAGRGIRHYPERMAGQHGHAGHSHGINAGADRRLLSLALALITVFMAAEVVVGLLSHSLALLSDAAHMLTDAAAIALALVAMRLAERPPRGGYTYGLKRAEILSAQANGLTLLLLAAWLTYTAIRRLIHPPAVEGWPVLVTAAVGIAVNLLATWLLSRANRTSLNVEGAYQHVLTDLFAFVATAVAGAVILSTGFVRADGIASLVVVTLMVVSGVRLVGESGRIFLEGAPAGIDPARLGALLAARPQVAEVHDLHVWQITSGEPAASAHVLVVSGGDCHAVRRDLERVLRGDYGIEHSTLQVDHAEPEVLAIGRRVSPPHCAEPPTGGNPPATQ
jgi:cobalt-zinc-cadmium efflux system protein